MWKLFSLWAAALTALFLPSAAQAWGEYGHLTVCEVAYRNLTPIAREQVKGILQSNNGGIVVRNRDGVEQRRYTRFNIGCLEEDERPRRHPKDHFLNVARSLPAIDRDTCPLSTATGEELACIFGGIERDMEILGDAARSSEDRAFALMALGHWIGDLHQPLHISFADDAGGNDIPVKLEGRCGSSRYRVANLHGMWDNCLPEAGIFERVRQRHDYKSSWNPRTIAYRAADTLMANTSVATERAYATGSPWQWAAESYAITRATTTAYCTVQGDTCVPIPLDGDKRLLSQAYLQANKGIAEERLAKAGFRLAHVLNQTLDPSYAGPVANGMQPQ